MRPIYAAAVGFAVAGGAASAQQTFLSYGDALNTLLNPSGDTYDVSGGPGTTSCPALYNDAADISTPTKDRLPTEIGPNLFRNCNVEQNGAFGSTRSLGFASEIPTSTFVPFETDRVRQQNRDAQSGNAGDTSATEGLTISSRSRPPSQFFVWSELSTTDIDESIHEPGQENDSVSVGATILTARGDSGIWFSLGRSEGRSDRAVIDEITNTPFQNATFDAYRSACAALSGGRTESAGLGVTGFHTQDLGGADLQIFAGAAASRTEYSNDLCYYTLQADPRALYAGRLRGAVETYAVSAGATLSSTFQLGRVALRPAVGLDYTHTRRPGYRETEEELTSAIDALASLPPPPSGDKVVPTGASLTYDSQDTDSMRMRVGGSAYFPVNGRSALSASAFFVKEFYDDPQIVTARFNEDLRDAPTRFSFLTNRLPTDYVELGLGYHRSADRPGEFGYDLRVASRLGDSLYETYSVSFAVRSEF